MEPLIFLLSNIKGGQEMRGVMRNEKREKIDSNSF
jgi:hypothetical protein